MSSTTVEEQTVVLKLGYIMKTIGIVTGSTGESPAEPHKKFWEKYEKKFLYQTQKNIWRNSRRNNWKIARTTSGEIFSWISKKDL